MTTQSSPQQEPIRDIVTLIKTAADHHRAGRFEEAERGYRDALAIDPKHFHALRLLGALYLQTSRAADAESLLRQALRASPDNAEVLNNLAIALQNSGKTQEAAEITKRLAVMFWSANQMDSAGTFFERTIQLCPDDVESMVNLGMTLHLRNRFEDAVRMYQKAINLQPDFAEAYVNLGAALYKLGRLDEAIECHERALKLNPNCVHALVELGCALGLRGRQDEAQEKYEQALRLQPTHAAALTNLGVVWYAGGEPKKALELYNKALRTNPNHTHARVEKGYALLAMGQYAEGWAFHEAGLGQTEWRGPFRFAQKMWDGSIQRDKRLLIWCEQGYGDTLQFIRYAALCKERLGKVYVQCPKPLARLLRQCPFIDGVFDAVRESQFDEHIAMMSLPHVFGTILETVPSKIPYLFVTPETAKKWAAKLSKAHEFKVGLAWAGNARENQLALKLVDRRRSLHLAQLQPLLDFKNVDFYSLQKGPAAEQINTLGLRSRINDRMDQVDDFMDTAAIIQNLDLVITVDTSVAHLAGALGKPVWVLSRYDACWRWLRNRETNPWYPTARVFGQPSPGDWDSVVTNVREALSLARSSV